MGRATTDRVLLVTGFGPFLEVQDNPSGRLAEAVDGVRLGRPGEPGLRVVGAVLPVDYDEAPARTVSLARSLGAFAIVGTGVALGREQVCVERWGRRLARPDLADVGGRRLADLEPGGPVRVEATAPVVALAQALGALVSEDAGGYVCNAWLYRVLRALARSPGVAPDVAFLHIPPQGLAPERLLGALDLLWSPPSTAASPPPTT